MKHKIKLVMYPNAWDDFILAFTIFKAEWRYLTVERKRILSSKGWKQGMEAGYSKEELLRMLFNNVGYEAVVQQAAERHSAKYY